MSLEAGKRSGINSSQFTAHLLPRWLLWLAQIERQVGALLGDRDIYRNVIEIVKQNPKTHDPNDFVMWFAVHYVEATAVRVRKQLDMDSRSASLARLLGELHIHATSIDRAWYVSQWSRENRAIGRADEAFDYWAGPCPDHANPVLFESHLRELQDTCQPIMKYVNKRIAHHDKRPTSRIAIPQWADLNRAIDTLDDKTCLCISLLRQEIAELTPAWQYDWMRVLDAPWRTK